ncbi:3-dehydroquinate synthase [bacterium]|nr:3-dehydroquinate synthase [bacterium]
MNNDIQVNIPEKESHYNIYIDDTPIEDLKNKILDFIGEQNYLVVISKKVNKLYSKKLNFDKEKVLVINDGEREKNIYNFIKIIDRLEKDTLTRKSYIIAIGGGVIGDMAGFAASAYRRGIRLIQVPTTLLSCVDSSVGGKVAINTVKSKNMIGAFYQPSAVFINLNFLNTLDNKQFKSGIGEVLKYAFIEKSCMNVVDYKFFDFLNINADKILSKDFNFLDKIIRISLALKIAVVTKDEKEQGLRKILNFGHTYGHAIEEITNFSAFTHGEAVVYGMYFIFNYAHKMQLIDANYREKALSFLDKFGFKDKPNMFNKNKLIKFMYSDKKVDNDKIKVIVPVAPGFVKEFDLDTEKAFN